MSRDYVCHNGIVNCVNHKPTDNPDEIKRQKQYKQIEDMAKLNNVDLTEVDKHFQTFVFNPKMRPCSGNGPCQCFPSEDYEWKDTDTCLVMEHIKKNGIKKSVAI